MNVVVTGASRGLGKSIAIYFASKGFNVVVNYLNSEKEALKLKEKIEKYNVEALLVKADVSKEEDVIKLYNESINKFGKIDVLVNNAGIAIDTLVEDKTVNDFKKILDVNLIGTFLTCKYFGKKMMEEKCGSIVNISSTNAIDTYYPYSMDYDASKAGVISLTHNFALEYAPYVRVNSIAPGWIKTDMNKLLDENQIKEEENKILLGRFATTEEIAKTVYFVGVEGTYINSSVIRVDGGVK